METWASIMQHSRYKLPNSQHIKQLLHKYVISNYSFNHLVEVWSQLYSTCRIFLYCIVLYVFTLTLYLRKRKAPFLSLSRSLPLYLIFISITKKDFHVCVIVGICCSVGAAACWLWGCSGRREDCISGEKTPSWTEPIPGWYLLIHFIVALILELCTFFFFGTCFLPNIDGAPYPLDRTI